MELIGLKGARLVGEYLNGLEDGYAIIGGSACEVLMHDADLEFRSTKDVDIVLIAECRLPEVGRAIWKIVHDGGYRCGWKGAENARFYRFTEPAQAGFPEIIELFGTAPEFLKNIGGLTVALSLWTGRRAASQRSSLMKATTPS